MFVVVYKLFHSCRNVGGNIRDGITGFSGSVMSKPREFAHLIKNKFGSADNINHLSSMYNCIKCTFLGYRTTYIYIFFILFLHGIIVLMWL